MGIKKQSSSKPHGKNRSTAERRHIKLNRVRKHGHFRGDSEPREFYRGSRRWVLAATVGSRVKSPVSKGLKPQTTVKVTEKIIDLRTAEAKPSRRHGISTPFDGFWAGLDNDVLATTQMMTSGTRCF